MNLITGNGTVELTKNGELFISSSTERVTAARRGTGPAAIAMVRGRAEIIEPIEEVETALHQIPPGGGEYLAENWTDEGEARRVFFRICKIQTELLNLWGRGVKQEETGHFNSLERELKELFYQLFGARPLNWKCLEFEEL